MRVSDCDFLWEVFAGKKKVKGEVHVMKNLNINSKLFSREVKNPNCLISIGNMLSFHVVPRLRDSLLLFVLFPLGFETVPHLLR